MHALDGWSPFMKGLLEVWWLFVLDFFAGVSFFVGTSGSVFNPLTYVQTSFSTLNGRRAFNPTGLSYALGDTCREKT